MSTLDTTKQRDAGVTVPLPPADRVRVPDAPAPAPRGPGFGRSRQAHNLITGLAFIAPNLLGFVAFTAVPLIVAVALAFTNGSLTLHGEFRSERLVGAEFVPEPFRFVGLQNFYRLLFVEEDFWRFLGNTLFLMMSMPFAIAASLGTAMLLSRDLRGGSRRTWLTLLAGAVLVASVALLVIAGAGGTGMTLLLGGVTCAILVGGMAGGSTVYRTLFYVPHFTGGVASLLLWKKLYNPTSGPITVALTGPVEAVERAVNAVPAWAIYPLAAACLALAVALLASAARRLRRYWEDGDVGTGTALMSAALLALPVLLALQWWGVVNWWGIVGRDATFLAPAPVAAAVAPDAPEGAARLAELRHQAARLLRGGAAVLLVAGAVVALLNVAIAARADKTFVARNRMEGVGTGVMMAAGAMVAALVLIGLTAVLALLPAWSMVVPGLNADAADGLATPKWLADPAWAKPSIMLMGFWGAVGSNTMLLYLAALTNVPQELYEASDIDGAGRSAKFWNVTWPQLAPTTFFVVVMGVIGGLQGGFEMARVLTQGGPDKTTTTLSYFIYTEGFETGRLGYSSGVAWTLFFLVMVVTLFNVKFGNKYVNE